MQLARWSGVLAEELTVAQVVMEHTLSTTSNIHNPILMNPDRFSHTSSRYVSRKIFSAMSTSKFDDQYNNSKFLRQELVVSFVAKALTFLKLKYVSCSPQRERRGKHEDFWC
jgi:hypothetical protein